MKYKDYKITMEAERVDTYEHELNKDGTPGSVIHDLTKIYGCKVGKRWYRVYRPNGEHQGSYNAEKYWLKDIKKIIDEDNNQL